jgi:cyclophilin family peptidyl-prolyl cis-trans isomerase
MFKTLASASFPRSAWEHKLLTLCVVLLFASANAPAQEKSPADQFQSVHREWNAVEKQLTDLQNDYQKAAPTAREPIKKQYEELVERSKQLLSQLASTAEAAYIAEPNKDNDVLRILIGIMSHNYRQDDYEAALKIAKLLDDNKCPERAFYAIAGPAAYSSDNFELAERYLLLGDRANKLDSSAKDMLAELPAQKMAWTKEQAIREKEAAAADLPRVKLDTSKGTIVIELFENEAPQAVGNFVSLVDKKYYDGLTFHRVLPGFMAQGGDPTGSGSGGPGYKIYCECEKPEARKHFRGTLSMAHAGKDTGGSQFFLTFRPTTHLDGRHTAFGRVIDGFDVLAKLQRRDPQSPNPPTPDKIIEAKILRKRDHAYEPTKVK